jgi:hypothetical protein
MFVDLIARLFVCDGQPRFVDHPHLLQNAEKVKANSHIRIRHLLLLLPHFNQHKHAGHPLVSPSVELETVPGDHSSGICIVSARSLAARLIDGLLLPSAGASSPCTHALPVLLEATRATVSLVSIDPGKCQRFSTNKCNTQTLL